MDSVNTYINSQGLQTPNNLNDIFNSYWASLTPARQAEITAASQKPQYGGDIQKAALDYGYSGAISSQIGFRQPTAPTGVATGGLTTNQDAINSANAFQISNTANQTLAAQQLAAINTPTTTPSAGTQTPYYNNNPTQTTMPANPIPPSPTNTLPNVNPQLNALNTTGNTNSTTAPVGATPTTNNGVGNSTSGNQFTAGQTGASFGNVSQQTTPQDSQRQAIANPNNITGYQDLSTNNNQQ